MKIVHVINSLETGGAEMMLLKLLVENLQRKILAFNWNCINIANGHNVNSIYKNFWFFRTISTLISMPCNRVVKPNNQFIDRPCPLGAIML